MGILLVSLVFLGIGCGKDAEQQAGQAEERNMVQGAAAIAKVKVDRAGAIFLNGKTVTLEELRNEFARLKEAGGTVWYFREDPQGEPPAQAMAVIQAIVDAQLPVRLLEKDFD